MKLSAHFHLGEFTRSESAIRFGREVVVPDDLMPNLIGLVTNVLEPFRVARGKAIFISSGYRPGWLNTLIGGSKTSQHMLAAAADFIEHGARPFETAQAMAESGLPFDQVIHEFGRWTHVSWSETPRGSILTAVRGDRGVQYLPGIQEVPHVP